MGGRLARFPVETGGGRGRMGAVEVERRPQRGTQCGSFHGRRMSADIDCASDIQWLRFAPAARIMRLRLASAPAL